MLSKKIIFTTIVIIFGQLIFASDSETIRSDTDEEKYQIDMTITSVDGADRTLVIEKTVDSDEAGPLVLVKDIKQKDTDETDVAKIEHILEDETNCCARVREIIENALAGLGTAKGAVGIACFTGITQGLLNFGWAFNWAKHANVDPDMSMKVQEICGIVSSLEIIFLGALFPYMMHKYTQNIQAEAAKKDD